MDASFQVGFYQDNQVLRESYSLLLQDYEWDFWITQTYRRLRRDQIFAAIQWFETIASKFDATRAFIAVERHQLDGVHLHALTRHLGPRFRPESLWKYLWKAYGRVTVEGAKHPGAVADYCSKYTLKAGYHYELCGFADAWNLDK